jgi:hypothetical protein
MEIDQDGRDIDHPIRLPLEDINMDIPPNILCNSEKDPEMAARYAANPDYLAPEGGVVRFVVCSAEQRLLGDKYHLRDLITLAAEHVGLPEDMFFALS